MSAGYLGKVSALVTVNTSDIASKVQSGFAAPFEKALRSIETTLRNVNRSADRSFGEMYTSAQKRARAIAAAQMGAVKGFDSSNFSKKMMISDDIAVRIGKIASAVERASSSIRSKFEPAVVSVQAEAQALMDEFEKGLPVATSDIVQMAKKVDDLATSLMGAESASKRMADSIADNVGLRTNLAQARRVEANVGASSVWAPGAREAMIRANVGESSPVNFQTPYQRGLVGPAGPVNTGTKPVSIEGMGMRTNLPVNFLQRNEDERNARRQRILDESAARARDAAERRMQEDAQRQRDADQRAMARNASQARRVSDTEGFATSFGGRGAAGITLGLDRNALAASTAELQIIQRAIGKASAEARGPAVEAFMRLRNAISDAFENGTLETEATRRAIGRLRTDAVNAAAQVSGTNRQSLGRDVQRAGDISRGGLDKFSLALQQAGFAIDDFFSATGGLDQKIRAVSNNISQMAFILGGTAGLFTGIAFTITAQVVVAMMKWSDAGRTTEDRVNALNSALENQKSLASDLSAAYRDLAKSLSAAMSPQGRRASDQEGQLKDIAAKRRAVMEESIYANDVGVAGARASVVVAEKEAAKASTAGQQQAAQLRIELARRRVDEAKQVALLKNEQFNNFVGNGVGAGNAVQASIQQAIQTFARIRISSEPGNADVIEAQMRRDMAAVPIAGNRADAAAQLRSYIESEFQRNENARNPGVISSPIVGGLLEDLAKLDFGLKEINAKLIDDVSRSLVGTSDIIEQAKKSLDDAAMETQDVAALRTEIDRVSASLEALSLAASETTDKGVLDAIAEDAAAAKELGARLAEAAGRAKDFADKLHKAIAEENAAAERGVDLGKIRNGMGRANDIRAAAANIGNDAAREEFVRQAFRNVRQDTASALVGYEAERNNALMAGAGRQALNASDATTDEGARELNRLLRGDDASRDVNFAELKHQSDLLQQIADGIKEATGIVVDFR